MNGDDILNPFCLFSGFFGLYNGLLLLRMSLPEVQSQTAYPVKFSPEDYFRSGLLSAAASITISLTWVAFRQIGARRYSSEKEAWFPRRDYYSAGFIGVLLGFAVKVAGFWQAGGLLAYLTMSRIDLFDVDSPNSIKLPAAPFVIAGLSLMIYAAGPKLLFRKRLCASFVAWTALLLLQGDRRPLLQLILAALVTWSASRSKQLKVRLATLLLLIPLYIGANLFAQFRYLIPAILQSGSMGDVALWSVDNATFDLLMPENTEFAGPYLSTLSAVSNSSRKLFGGSYLTGFLGIMPGPIYPGIKPVMLGQSFANEMAFGPGPAAGWGFNPAAEAFMNFGWCGAILVMCLWTISFIALNRLRDYRPVGLMIASALASEAINANRIDFSNVCSESFQCSGSAIIVFFIAVLLRRTVSSQR